jgi:hypothetical protein
VSHMTILRWAKSLGSSFLRLRDGLVLKYEKNVPAVTSRAFIHSGQAYGFMLHNWKLREFCHQEGLREYLSGLGPWIDGYFASGSRCSELRNIEHVETVEKRNFLCDAAARILSACDELRERHSVLEEYLVFNDSSTIAAEVPVFMFDKGVGKIHGHIDLVQVRFGKVWVVDYKPGARSVDRMKVASQLYWYARGLSYRAKIPLSEIRCCWFDSEVCFEFDPGTVRLKAPQAPAPADAPEML